jgi:hypothetical protein
MEVIVRGKAVLLMLSAFIVVGCQSFTSVKEGAKPTKSAKSAKQLKKEEDQWKQIKKDIEVLLGKTDQLKLQKYQAKAESPAFKFPTSI